MKKNTFWKNSVEGVHSHLKLSKFKMAHNILHKMLLNFGKSCIFNDK